MTMMAPYRHPSFHPAFPVRSLLVFLSLFIALARPCMAEKQALLIGVDRYSFLSEAEQMFGVRRDVERMNLLLKYCKFTVTQVVGEKATASDIREAMAALVASAKAGDDVVLYFSGRGSVRFDPKEPDQKTDLEPTLVPADGKAEDASGDILMSEIEAFAKEVQAKKANPVILLDACFARRASRSEDRFYRDIPRSIPRPGSVRGTLFNGPGVFLSAAGPSGQAYEWRVDFNTNAWRGAFTDFWTNAAMRRLKNGETPSYALVTDDVRRYFSLKKGYMVGFSPYPQAERVTSLPDYQKPIFGMAKGVPPATGAPQAQVTAVVQQQAKRTSTLRVGIARWQEDIPQSEFDSAAMALGEQLQAQLKGVTVVPTFGDRPDRIVYLSKEEGRLMARVVGSEVDAYRQPEFRADDPKGLLSEGLSDYLQRQAFALVLFRKTDGSAKPTLTGVSLMAKSEKPTYSRGQRFNYQMQIPADGLLYILDSNDSDGVVSLIWPVGAEWDNDVKKGKLSVPRKIRYVLPEDMIVPTRTVTRAILVVPAKGVKLPPLSPAAGSEAWAGDTPEYSAVERAHLAALLDALEKGQVRWTAVTFEYQVD